MTPYRIAILAYRGCMATQVFGIADLLRVAADVDEALGCPRKTRFEVEIVGLAGRSVAVAGGLALQVRRPRPGFDLLIVPGLEARRGQDWSAALAPLAREHAFIRKTFAGGTAVASVCVGAFMLGEAGLLNGRQVTTAWLFAAGLAARYPAAKVDAEAILREDGGVTTTAAVSSAFDLALHLVKRRLGAEVAAATARAALLPAQRTSQAPYVDPALAERPLPSFSANLWQWFERRLAQPYDLERVALAFRVSSRTLMRRVKAETGMSPLTLLQEARVSEAKRLLSGTDWPVARIVEAVGYSDAASFSRLFARRVGTTPARYRAAGDSARSGLVP
jgi:transcriptional regulator GlxA family with amidase domain